MSCAWYGVGRLGGADGWLQQRADSGIWQSYLECLNWAFAQLSVGSSDILPANTLELAFCCIIAFRSLITYSTLISGSPLTEKQFFSILFLFLETFLLNPCDRLVGPECQVQ